MIDSIAKKSNHIHTYTIGKQIITITVNLLALMGFLLEIINYHEIYSTYHFSLQIISICILVFTIILLSINKPRFYSISYLIVSYNVILNIILSITLFPKFFDRIPFSRSDYFSRDMFFILCLIALVGFVVSKKHIIIQTILLVGFILYELIFIRDLFIIDSAALYLVITLGFGWVLYFLVTILNKFLFDLQESNFQNKLLVSKLGEKNKEILASINYARRLQSAILPPGKLVEKYLINSFIIYKPKDIVAGDFYWMEVVGDNIIFALADCTGHGVPGAMVSVVCHNALNRAVREFNLIDPGQILDKTSENVIEQFEKSEESVSDGMDIALCVYNRKQNTLKWAGANSPILHCRNGVLTKFKPTKQPIGNYINIQPFATNTITLEKGDMIYLYSDGYIDQFGGPNLKKMKYRKLNEMILETHSHSMAEQRQFFEQFFDKWKGMLDQIDDVCLIGVRFD